MSAIRETPFIQKIIASMSATQLVSLLSMMDNPTPQATTYVLGSSDSSLSIPSSLTTNPQYSFIEFSKFYVLRSLDGEPKYSELRHEPKKVTGALFQATGSAGFSFIEFGKDLCNIWVFINGQAMLIPETLSTVELRYEILDAEYSAFSSSYQAVSRIDFSNANTSLDGLKIGNTSYKVVPCGNASGYGSTASGLYSTANGNGSTAIGFRAISKILRWVSFDGNDSANASPQNNYITSFSPDYVLFRNANVDYNATTTSAYANLKTLTDYLGVGAPTIVTTETIEGMIAGTSADFSVTGSGTSGSPYVITPKADLSHPHQHRVYQISVTSAPTADAYVRFKASGTERCLIQFTLNAAGAHGYIINFQNLYGWTRSRNVLNGGTLSSTDINTSTATGKTLIDINDPGMYITYAL